MLANCIGIADFAHAHGCHNLYVHARDYIYRHFGEVSKGDEFLQLSHSQVVQVLDFFSKVIYGKVLFKKKAFVSRDQPEIASDILRK